MPTSGFEVRGRIVRRRLPRFANVHFEVDGRGQEFAVVRQGSPTFVGVAVSVAVKTSIAYRRAPVDWRPFGEKAS